MSVILLLLSLSDVHAYEVGSAPFCVVDNIGNQECYYYTLDACRQAAKLKLSTATCIPNNQEKVQ